jgi:hypothetical protein
MIEGVVMRGKAVGAAGAIGLAIVSVLSAYAIAAPETAAKRSFTETLTGATISADQSAYKVTSSLDGAGAAIQHMTVIGTKYPLRGTLTQTDYFADGVSKAKGTFTLGALFENGLSTITGHGQCLGGTRVHRNEKCTFFFRGTYNSKTTIAVVQVIGTDTR